jgi:hypothetical protein
MAKSKSKLGDTRLERVHGLLIYAMSQKMSVVLRQLSETDAEEASFGRFINNKKVTPAGIVAHCHHVAPVNFTGKHVLVIQDTSTASFGLHSNRKGLGYVGPKTNKTGFDLHPTIYMDAADGACYGLGSLNVDKTKIISTQAEEEAKLERRKNCWKIPFIEKERYKWYSTVEQAIKNNNSADKYTVIGDREADIYDLFAMYQEKEWEYLIRNAHDRKLSNGNTLYSTINDWSVEDIYQIKLPKTKKRSAHRATLMVKFGAISVARPKLNPNKTLPDAISLYVVEVKECPSTVVGNEAPIHWRLLTSHPIETIEQARTLIQWYRWRWVIEQVFRTLKSKGLNIEKSEVESYEALINLSTLALLAAVQVLQLVQARDGNTAQSIDSVFSEQEIDCLNKLNEKLEGKTEKSKNPHPIATLAFACWVLARLGGWKGYKKSRPSGPITMLNGLIRFYDIMEGYYLRL